MQYFGGKAKLSKYIIPILKAIRNGNQAFIEPFVGGANIVSKMDGRRYAYDLHKPLIEMYKKLQLGWEPPSVVSEDLYKKAKNGELPIELTAFIGFGCSYAGRYFGGFARGGAKRNYALNAKNSLLKKKSGLCGVEFNCSDYADINPSDSLVYCDPPYKGRTGYSLGVFDSVRFWDTMRNWSKNNIVVISEHFAPSDFKPIWVKEHKRDIRDGQNKNVVAIEKLYVHESLYEYCINKMNLV